MRKAVELLIKNFMLTVDRLEPIRRGSAKILYLFFRKLYLLLNCG